MKDPEIIITCNRYASEELHSWGMISRIVPPEKLLDAARELAGRLFSKSPKAVTGSKLTVNTLAAVAAREMSTFDPEVFIHR